jgi:DNA mismatch repair protein MutS
MATHHVSRHDSESPDAGASARRPGPPHALFESILFERLDGDGGDGDPGEPDFFRDLNLDRVVSAAVEGRERYDLNGFFYAPLHDVRAVRYRQEVLRDLEKEPIRAAVERFAEELQRMRDHLQQVEKLRERLQKQGWFLDAVAIYCGAVAALARDLEECEVAAPGLAALRRFLSEHAASDSFTALVAETEALRAALGEVEYAVHIHGGRVTVRKPEGEPDQSAVVEEIFARFRQGAVKSYLVRLSDFPDMNQVEERIVGLVAKLYPDVFGALAAFCDRHRDFLDPTIARFDREVQFYLGYLGLVDRLRTAGLPFCYPEVSVDSKEIEAEDTFDLALANKLVAERGTVVCNDFRLGGDERALVVTGPNNGGKTTFARGFGQVHHLAALGLLVPGRRARLLLPDRIFAHFEREEDVATLRGKFEDELVRVHGILEEATSSSVVVMNESFGSTSLSDALTVGGAVLRKILELGAVAVYVTFVDELTALGEATVSMVSQIVPENPAERTFKVIRKPADGLAYAWAIADKYGLTYERLMETIGP